MANLFAFTVSIVFLLLQLEKKIQSPVENKQLVGFVLQKVSLSRRVVRLSVLEPILHFCGVEAFPTQQPHDLVA